VQDLIAREKLPENFGSIIPAKVRELAGAVYDDWERPLYPEVQKEMAMKLLQLRVRFTENTKPVAPESELDKSILNQFKVPFRIAPA